jgi:RND superfamily putative drug exporter
VLHWAAGLAVRAPRRVLGLAFILTLALTIFGIPVADSPSSSGFQDPESESTSATKLLTTKFG